jgi:small subunit ribosomal protein S16
VAISIRLQRLGANHKPYYRVVVTEGVRATQGKALEILGRFDPLAKDKTLRLDTAKAEAWRKRGAVLSPSVARILKRAADVPKV